MKDGQKCASRAFGDIQGCQSQGPQGPQSATGVEMMLKRTSAQVTASKNLKDSLN